MRDRYLCQFQDMDKDYFVTDCAFQEGQVNKTIGYVKMIVSGVGHVRKGQVFDAKHQKVVYRCP